MASFFGELKRRNVFRVAALYVAVGWALLQVVDVLAPAIALPEWVTGFVALLLIVGFPIALIFAWAFELTPEGVRRTEAVDPGESITESTGRRLDGLLVVVLLVFGAIVVGDRFLPDRDGDPGNDSGPASAGTPTRGPSLAVLPFVDMSPEGDQEYFGDGIAEELLNLFAQVKGLSVAGRTSAFAFKASNRDLREIGEILDVQHILEGSVRKAGQQIRVTAQLIKVDDGYHVWSATYDGKLDDIFGVQDTIAAAILDELAPQLVGGTASAPPRVRVAPTDLSAYDLYLLSKQYEARGTTDGLELAADALDRALVIDPDYVPALVWRGYYELMLSDGDGAWGDKPFEEAAPRARAWIDRAVELDPDSPDVKFGLATYFGFGTTQNDAALRYFREALEAKPSFPVAQNDLAFFLTRRGELKEARALLQDALAHNPAYVDANVNLLTLYALFNDREAQRAHLDRWQRVAPNDANRLMSEGRFAKREGDFGAAIRFAEAAVALEPDAYYFQFHYYNVLLLVGEYERVLASDVTSLHPYALIGAARPAEAIALARRQLDERPDYYLTQERFVRTLAWAGAWEPLARYFDRTWGSVTRFIDTASDQPLFTELATALQVTGHPLAGEMLAAFESEVARSRAAGVAWHWIDVEEGVLRLLQGRESEALGLFEAAIEHGFNDAYAHTRAFWALVEDQERIGRLLARMREDTNASRVRAGLQPI